MAVSKQTPADRVFYYNPLAGASVNIFHKNGRDRKHLTLTDIHPFSRDYDKELGGKQAIAAGGAVRIVLNGVQPVCYINGNEQPGWRFSIIYAGRKRKQTFAAY